MMLEEILQKVAMDFSIIKRAKVILDEVKGRSPLPAPLPAANNPTAATNRMPSNAQRFLDAAYRGGLRMSSRRDSRIFFTCSKLVTALSEMIWLNDADRGDFKELALFAAQHPDLAHDAWDNVIEAIIAERKRQAIPEVT